MWNFTVRLNLVICSLFVIGLLNIASYTNFDENVVHVKNQLRSIALGYAAFFLAAKLDYRKLREWTFAIYIFVLITLIFVFFSRSIVGVHRWFRIPILNFSVQPSECAKIGIIITLSWFFERQKQTANRLSTTLSALCLVIPPFLLIAKQPDLGSALVLYPITLAFFAFGRANRLIIKIMTFSGGIALLLIVALFLGIIPVQTIKPIALKALKEYQFNRLDPSTHHQNAAATAIAIGGIKGVGWKKSIYAARGWLPTPYTDSVFPAFGEEFGLLGLSVLLFLLYSLIYLSFSVTATACDDFGTLLSAGIATYITSHILMNVGMMCGFLPITGVPLPLVTYGGSSIISTMLALGILKSVHDRRFVF